jgi:hypothetical protein
MPSTPYDRPMRTLLSRLLVGVGMLLSGCGDSACNVPAVLERFCEEDECECEPEPLAVVAYVDLWRLDENLYLVTSPGYGGNDICQVRGVAPDIVPFQGLEVPIVVRFENATIVREELPGNGETMVAWFLDAADCTQILFCNSQGDTLALITP